MFRIVAFMTALTCFQRRFGPVLSWQIAVAEARPVLGAKSEHCGLVGRRRLETAATCALASRPWSACQSFAAVCCWAASRCVVNDGQSCPEMHAVLARPHYAGAAKSILSIHCNCGSSASESLDDIILNKCFPSRVLQAHPSAKTSASGQSCC